MKKVVYIETTIPSFYLEVRTEPEWNCKHLANANKFSHIRRLNTLLGLYVPALITPVELLSWEE